MTTYASNISISSQSENGDVTEISKVPSQENIKFLGTSQYQKKDNPPISISGRSELGVSQKIQDIFRDQQISGLDRTDLLNVWKAQQSESQRKLQKTGLSYQASLGFVESAETLDDNKTKGKNVAFSGSLDDAIKSMAIILPSFAEQFVEGNTVIGKKINAENLRWLSVPKKIEKIGSDFNAEKLGRLDFYTKVFTRSYADPAYNRDNPDSISRVEGGYIREIGDRFHAPNLTSLDISEQKNFGRFGKKFNSPNLVFLSLKNAENFKEFPADFHAPSIVTLDLSGANAFERFPTGFLDRLPNLRSIELRGTAVRYRDLPEHIRANLDIHIDIRPVAEMAQNIGGQQSTHHASIHFSSSQSAERIVNASSLDDQREDREISELTHYIMNRPVDPMPETFKQFSSLPISELNDHLFALNNDHPHRRYVASPINSAQRAVSAELPHRNFIDDKSNVTVKRYLASCWNLTKTKSEREDFVDEATAKDAFVQILYEISRGYNLKGDNLEDNGDARDLLICGSGAFNKITNGMSSILKKAETLYITNDSIRLKIDSSIKNYVTDIVSTGFDIKEIVRNEDEGRFLNESGCGMVRNDLFKKVEAYFRLDGEPHDERSKRSALIAGYLDYQLGETDLREVIDAKTKNWTEERSRANSRKRES